jgi:pectate lyase
MLQVIRCILAVLLAAGLARAAALIEEPFAYVAGALDGQGAWNGGSGSQVAAGSLSFPGLQSPGVTSNKVVLPSTASTAARTFHATGISNGSIYLSFLLQQTTLAASTTGGTVAGLDDDGGFTTSNGRVAAGLGIHLKQTNANRCLVGIRKGQGTSGAGGGTDVYFAGGSFAVNDTLLIVAKYTFNPGAGDDTVELWVNPPVNSLGATEPPAGVAATTTGNATDAPGLRHVFVRCNSSTVSGINELDDVRVGVSWADVTPPSGPVAPAPAPVITQVLPGPQGVVLRGTNGTPAGTYQVLGATDAALPMTNWPCVAAHHFDANGNFDSTNPVLPGASPQFFRLLVGGPVPPGAAAPAITSQPQSQSGMVSNHVTFAVSAIGAAPLTYQWRFNSNTPVGVNSREFTLFNVQSNHAGGYSVIITNAYGATTSAVATFTVNPWSPTPDFSLAGFAAMDGFVSNGTWQAGGTTGGAGGALVLASNAASFQALLESADVHRVLVISNLDLSVLANHSGGFPAGFPTGEILVRSHKTVFSTNGATISRGSLRIGKASLGPQRNIIIRNLRFRDLWVHDPSGNYDTYGWDYIRLEEGSHHVWIDHCDFERVYDGMVDLTHGSDYTTVSWNVFRAQKKCSLVGHSDGNAAEDTGHLNVTYHHNHFVDVDERMPRMRFGNAHVFNTYCENLGGNGIQSTAKAATLVEHSHWQFPQSGSLPTREENGGPTGIVKVVSCVISNLPGVNVQFRQHGHSNFLFNAPFAGATPPYSYQQVMHPVAQVPAIVTNWAGVGKVTGF